MIGQGAFEQRVGFFNDNRSTETIDDHNAQFEDQDTHPRNYESLIMRLLFLINGGWRGLLVRGCGQRANLLRDSFDRRTNTIIQT